MTELEGSDPAAAARIAAQSSFARNIDQDGKVKMPGGLSGYMWEPSSRAQITEVFKVHTQPCQSATTISVVASDGFTAISQPFCDELPRLCQELIAAEPTGKLAVYWRSYVRTVLLPLARRVADILVAHSTVIEWPPIQWLAEKVRGL